MAKKKKTTTSSEMPTEINSVDFGKLIERIEKEVKKFDDKTFHVYFYVIDTKGVPSGSLLYIYKIAYILQEMGYDVTMLHNEEEFIGIEAWADSKYSKMKHARIKDRDITVSASDFLIIPEIYTDIMSQTSGLPCKRVMLIQNFDFLTRIIPVGVHPYKYGITDAIVNTGYNAKMMSGNLPRIKTRLIRPGVQDALFRKGSVPKKMIVNFAVKDANDASRIVKPFFWKYPQLSWVTFTQLSNLPQETFANALRDAAFTIVVDDSTSFCYSALEALKTGSIVICKIPENVPDWMETASGDLTDSIIWVDNLDEVPDLLANLVAMWLRDDIPAELYEQIETVSKTHSMEDMKEDVTSVFVNGLFEERKKEIAEHLEKEKNKAKTEE